MLKVSFKQAQWMHERAGVPVRESMVLAPGMGMWTGTELVLHPLDVIWLRYSGDPSGRIRAVQEYFVAEIDREFAAADRRARPRIAVADAAAFVVPRQARVLHGRAVASGGVDPMGADASLILFDEANVGDERFLPLTESRRNVLGAWSDEEGKGSKE